MPPYFYSCDNGSEGIRAATGVKGILFPDNEAAKAFKAFWSSHHDPHLDDPDKKFAEAVKSLVEDSDFSEEMDHFNIVSRMGTTKSLYVWNILCRMAFSAYYQKNDPDNISTSRFVHREIVRYNFAYMYFFLAASPLVEESYDARTGKGKYHEALHAPNVEAARSFLKANKEVPSHEDLATAIDKAFANCWKRRKDPGIGLFYMHDKKPISFIKQAIVLQIFRPVLSSFSALSLVTLRFFELLWEMKGHFLKIILTGSNNQSVSGVQSATTPAILSPQGQIDPVAFTTNRKHWTSLEATGRSEKNIQQSNLLWYVISRCATAAIMTKANLDKAGMETHFSEEWNFYQKGFVSAQDVCWAADKIDRAIVKEVLYLRKSDPNALSNEEKIAEISMGIFHGIALKQFFEYEKKDRLDDFSKAFGITYMQV